MPDTLNDGASEVGEETPLLANEAGQVVENNAAATPNQDASADEKPLPKMQIVLLCFARVVEPISFFSIFPFVNQMVKDNGDLEYGEVGFYTGLIESLFSVVQMCVMIFWGRASDRYGRKPVLVFSLFGVAVCMGAFGLAQTIWQMILFRCLAGLFAGTIVTIRTMFSEHSTEKTQARAFSWFAFSGNVGIFVGPLLGGALAEPAKQYPSVFGNVELFRLFPYFLPTLVSGLIGLAAAIVSLFFVQETLASKTKPTAAKMTHEPPSPSASALLKDRKIVVVVLLYGYVMFLAYAYTTATPVYYFTPVELGGWGFTELQISLFMGLVGFSQAIWLVVIFPPLQRRLGTVRVTKLCATVYPIFFVTYPIYQAILQKGTRTAKIVFWILASLNSAIGTGVSMAFTTSQLSLNDVAPSPQVLGTLNALALTLTSGLRAVTPAAATSILAVGVQNQILGGQLIWLVLFLSGLGYTFAVRAFLPDNLGMPSKSNEVDGAETDRD